MKKIIQVIGIVACLIPLVGFGWCGAMGIETGVTSRGPLSGRILFIAYGLAAFAISIGFGFVIHMIFKNITAAPSDENPPAP